MMFGGGRGMGGGIRGEGGGNSMLRVASRAVTGRTTTTKPGHVSNLQDPISSTSSTVTSPRATHKLTSPTTTTNNTHLSLSSSSSSTCNSFGSPFAASGTCNDMQISSYYWPSFGDEGDWIPVCGSEGRDGERVYGVIDDHFVLGPVPSIDEVHSAVSALSQVFDTALSPTGSLHRVSSHGSELDWIEPSPYLRNSRAFSPYGPNRVYDAFHLLQSEPSVQKMVISLSSDKAVWDAVLNNEVVRELREIHTVDVASPTPESEDKNGDSSNPVMSILKWILENTKLMIDRITMLLNNFFMPYENGKPAGGSSDQFDEKLRTTFLLSIMVMLVVVVTRAHRV